MARKNNKQSIANVLGGLKKDTIRRNAARSEAWLKNKINKVDKEHKKNIPTVGKMSLFLYDPKGKDTLPFYDKFPLVIPFSMSSRSMTGINFHYLPPRLRVVLLDKLIAISGLKHASDNAKMKLSWNMLKAASVHKLVAPTVHMYLYSHMRSQLAMIPQSEWHNTVTLPLARFAKKSNVYVYSQSV